MLLGGGFFERRLRPRPGLEAEGSERGSNRGRRKSGMSSSRSSGGRSSSGSSSSSSSSSRRGRNRRARDRVDRRPPLFALAAAHGGLLEPLEVPQQLRRVRPLARVLAEHRRDRLLRGRGDVPSRGALELGLVLDDRAEDGALGVPAEGRLFLLFVVVVVERVAELLEIEVSKASRQARGERGVDSREMGSDNPPNQRKKRRTSSSLYSPSRRA